MSRNISEHDRLDAILAYVRNAQLAVLDASAMLRESQPAGPANGARLRLADATGHLSGATNHLYEGMADATEADGKRHFGDGSLSAPGGVMGDKARKMAEGWGRG